MKQVPLGNSNLQVSRIALGCMSMSAGTYGDSDDDMALATLERALELGINVFDTADIYGLGHNERLLARFLKDHRDEVIICTKFGFVYDKDGNPQGLNGSPAYVREACERSLKRLGIDTIDLYYAHRVDPETPIEETVGAMADLIQAGKVRYLGLSEASADDVRRAQAVHPISALQSEYSMWARVVEGEILDTCRELGISLFAFSPLGHGILTGKITDNNYSPDEDFRAFLPWFSDENFQHNLDLVQELKTTAANKGISLAQLALAWLIAQGEDIVPLPGTYHIKYLEDNAGAVDVVLNSAELAAIDAVAAKVKGSRSPHFT
jgi:aryl-alcohol dehydrogenase-like predicted oxidoreductase